MPVSRGVDQYSGTFESGDIPNSCRECEMSGLLRIEGGETRSGPHAKIWWELPLFAASWPVAIGCCVGRAYLGFTIGVRASF